MQIKNDDVKFGKTDGAEYTGYAILDSLSQIWDVILDNMILCKGDRDGRK